MSTTHYLVTEQDEALILHMRDRCSFNQLPSFERIMHAMEEQELDTVQLDMSALDHIDSSGLGLLLMLREKAVEHGVEVCIASPNADVKRILETTRLDTLFAVA